MDDLLGEDWKAPPKPTASTKHPSPFSPTYNSFRASPVLQISGTASPENISRPPSTLNGSVNAPANYHFGNLLSLKSQKQNSSLSILEQQQQALEEKRRQQEEQSRLWDNLGSGRGTPEPKGVSTGLGNGTGGAMEDEDDILAAFNKAAPVNRATYFPPSTASSGTRAQGTVLESSQTSLSEDHGVDIYGDDDDPFDLRSVSQQSNGYIKPAAATHTADEDNVLGDLGKPVPDFLTRKDIRQPSLARDTLELQSSKVIPETAVESKDRGVVDLVDMGFPADSAKIALMENGGDIQRAVTWLLQQAHHASKQGVQAESIQRTASDRGETGPSRGARREQEFVPSWVHDGPRSNSAGRRDGANTPIASDRDAAQVASDFGSRLFKGANTLWKAGQKQVAKTVTEFQQERSSNQPKWMQQTTPEESRSISQARQIKNDRVAAEITDEAAMLDGPRERPPKPKRPILSEQDTELPTRNREISARSSGRQASGATLKQQQSPSSQYKAPASKLIRQEIEEQAAQAYISPARRKNMTPRPEPPPEPEIDLFSSASAKPTTFIASSSPSQPNFDNVIARPSALPPKSKVPPRKMPNVSPSALEVSAKHRKAGGDAFKRGDYASAHEYYNAALDLLPADHPIAIIVLSNRSLTSLKTGNAKLAAADAERALTIIGVGQGAGENIDLGIGETVKDMRDFYGKALMRKAEALEHLEKWTGAAEAWRAAVEAGVGGVVSLRGKDRCEKAAVPQRAASKIAPARSLVSNSTLPAKSPGNSLHQPMLTSASSTEAVRKMRAANAAAEKAEDEKFALTDQVDARLMAWKGGKADNLRALLQSLDAVLWAEAGWKKVGMSDLVLPNKVKIVYMKAIAKVHPDKIPQDATTEQRMVSGAVFSTLNEAWDKFKKDNNL